MPGHFPHEMPQVPSPYAWDSRNLRENFSRNLTPEVCIGTHTQGIANQFVAHPVLALASRSFDVEKP